MQATKPILAIETSEKLCGAAIYFSDEKYYSYCINNKNIHSEKLFHLIDTLFLSSGININELEYIAVSNGPGSFTGLRIGLAAVKGLAVGAAIPILPVPTFEALALQVGEYLGAGTVYYIANKVNTDEVYIQSFKKGEVSVETLTPLKIVMKDEVQNIAGKELIFGNINSICNIKKISAPEPLYVAKWSRKFGSGNLLENFDFFEPDYIKEFLIKGAKNA